MSTNNGNNPSNIQEYVAQQVIKYVDAYNKENDEKDKLIFRMSRALLDTQAVIDGIDRKYRISDCGVCKKICFVENESEILPEENIIQCRCCQNLFCKDCIIKDTRESYHYECECKDIRCPDVYLFGYYQVEGCNGSIRLLKCNDNEHCKRKDHFRICKTCKT